MTADQHIKNAYSELLKAADLVKLETNQLRSDLQNTKQMMTAQLAQLAEQMRLVQRQQQLATDPNQQQDLNAQHNYLQRQISDKKREMDAEIRRIEDLIRQKERDSTTIQTQARTVAA